MKISTFLKVTALCAAPLLLTACGSDDDGTNNSTTAIPNAYKGTWTTPCVTDTNSPISVKGTLFITDNTVTMKTGIFNDQNCKKERSVLVTTTTQHITAGAVVDKDQNTEHRKVDLTMQKTEIMVMDQNILTTINNNVQTDFKLDTTYDITTNEEWCEHDDDTCKVGYVLRSIVAIKGNKLYLGDELANKDSEGRPLSIDYNGPFYTKL